MKKRLVAALTVAAIAQMIVVGTPSAQAGSTVCRQSAYVQYTNIGFYNNGASGYSVFDRFGNFVSGEHVVHLDQSSWNNYVSRSGLWDAPTNLTRVGFYITQGTDDGWGYNIYTYTC